MKVCLISPNSPFLINEDISPPMGLFYLSAVLKKAGHVVGYVDLGLGDKIQDGYDVYAVTGTSPQWNTIRQIPIWLHNSHCIAGGVHATVLPEDVLRAGYQSVCVGYGEGEILNMIDPETTGIVTGEIKHLDDLPFPDRTWSRRYHYDLYGRDATTFITARGCPYNCAFCGESYEYNRYRVRSAPNVIAELKELAEVWDYDALHIYDDTFIGNGRRLRDICAALKHYGFIWRCFARSNQVTAEMLQMMAESGCKEVAIGVESGSQEILDNINKGETIAQQQQAIKWAREAGIRVKAFIIVGLPGETHKTLMQTEKFLATTPVDDIGVTILSVMPGSPIYNHPENYDVKFDKVGHWFTGKPGEYVATVETSELSGKDLLWWRDHLEQRFKVWK